MSMLNFFKHFGQITKLMTGHSLAAAGRGPTLTLLRAELRPGLEPQWLPCDVDAYGHLFLCSLSSHCFKKKS